MTGSWEDEHKYSSVMFQEFTSIKYLNIESVRGHAAILFSISAEMEGEGGGILADFLGKGFHIYIHNLIYNKGISSLPQTKIS